VTTAPAPLVSNVEACSTLDFDERRWRILHSHSQPSQSQVALRILQTGMPFCIFHKRISPGEAPIGGRSVAAGCSCSINGWRSGAEMGAEWNSLARMTPRPPPARAGATTCDVRRKGSGLAEALTERTFTLPSLP
jgi:hypothetical protein